MEGINKWCEKGHNDQVRPDLECLQLGHLSNGRPLEMGVIGMLFYEINPGSGKKIVKRWMDAAEPAKKLLL